MTSTTHHDQRIECESCHKPRWMAGEVHSYPDGRDGLIALCDPCVGIARGAGMRAERVCCPAEERPDSYYLWTVDGELYGGTLADYARHQQHGHYSGVTIGAPYRAFVGADHAPTVVAVELESSASEADDYRAVELRDPVTGDEGSYRLDLRA
jgi:hypothetical protein